MLACGYNNHVGTDRCHGQIRALTATGAARHARADVDSALIGDDDSPMMDGARVFEPSGDVQAGLFVVRNFCKDGRELVLPPIERNASLTDAGMLFAVEALDRGYAVMRCQNIRLSKLGFSERLDASDGDVSARAGRNERIV